MKTIEVLISDEAYDLIEKRVERYGARVEDFAAGVIEDNSAQVNDESELSHYLVRGLVLRAEDRATRGWSQMKYDTVKDASEKFGYGTLDEFIEDACMALAEHAQRNENVKTHPVMLQRLKEPKK